MATDTTTIVPVETLFPYSGVTELLQNRSDFPRAEIIHARRDVTIPLTGVGDDSFVTIEGFLPLNFSYALTDLYFMIESAAGATNNYETSLSMSFQDSLFTVAGAGRTWELYLPNFARPALSTVLSTQVLTYEFPMVPSFIMRPPDGHQIGYTLGLINATTNDTAYNANFFARFQQFDINQSHSAIANLQTPIRGR